MRVTCSAKFRNVVVLIAGTDVAELLIRVYDRRLSCYRGANFFPQSSDGLDVENLGNGALMTFAIITPVLLVGYLMDGIDYVQNLFLESVYFWP